MAKMCAPVRSMVERVKLSKVVFFLAKMCAPVRGKVEKLKLSKVVVFFGKNVCVVRTPPRSVECRI